VPQDEPFINVGRLPVFDVAAGGFFLIGLYAYQKKYMLERTKIISIDSSVGIIIGALGQVTYAVVLLVPFAYAVAAAGIEYTFGAWNEVFPRNPLLVAFGIIVISLVVIASMYYQLTRFLVVWPQTPETRAEYSQSRIIN
jgi:lysylphosphatidylglycerol synthetase-like protein (DUF2156 family)